MAAIPRSVKLAGGAAAYVFGVGVAYEFSRPIPPLPSAKQRCCTFDSLAPGYDKDIEKDEQTSGILDLRKEMAKLARGKVLEIAGGTGRNLGFYDGDAVTDLLIGDYSEKMLHVAAHKVAHMRQPALIHESVRRDASPHARARTPRLSRCSRAHAAQTLV